MLVLKILLVLVLLLLAWWAWCLWQTRNEQGGAMPPLPWLLASLLLLPFVALGRALGSWIKRKLGIKAKPDPLK